MDNVNQLSVFEIGGLIVMFFCDSRYMGRNIRKD